MQEEAQLEEADGNQLQDGAMEEHGNLLTPKCLSYFSLPFVHKRVQLELIFIF